MATALCSVHLLRRPESKWFTVACPSPARGQLALGHPQQPQVGTHRHRIPNPHALPLHHIAPPRLILSDVRRFVRQAPTLWKSLGVSARCLSTGPQKPDVLWGAGG
jgi:hypothetical protein